MSKEKLFEGYSKFYPSKDEIADLGLSSCLEKDERVQWIGTPMRVGFAKMQFGFVFRIYLAIQAYLTVMIFYRQPLNIALLFFFCITLPVLIIFTFWIWFNERIRQDIVYVITSLRFGVGVKISSHFPRTANFFDRTNFLPNNSHGRKFGFLLFSFAFISKLYVTEKNSNTGNIYFVDFLNGKGELSDKNLQHPARKIKVTSAENKKFNVIHDRRIANDYFGFGNRFVAIKDLKKVIELFPGGSHDNI